MTCKTAIQITMARFKALMFRSRYVAAVSGWLWLGRWSREPHHFRRLGQWRIRETRFTAPHGLTDAAPGRKRRRQELGAPQDPGSHQRSGPANHHRSGG